MIVGYPGKKMEEDLFEGKILTLKNKGCHTIFSEPKTKRLKPLQKLKNYINENESCTAIMVVNIQDIFTTMRSFIQLLILLDQKEIKLISLQDPEWDFQKMESMSFLKLITELEKNHLSSRTKSGLKKAKENGIKVGRKKGINSETLDRYKYAKHLFEEKKYPIRKACKTASISKASYYRIENENLSS